uniref:Vacuolar ATPase assembly protein VMA22 n=1 Tax=Talaromyces marneffei PM1 TaxID=1077442 RepID=A0A093XWA1_TALMA
MTQIPTPPSSRGASIEPTEPEDKKNNAATTSFDEKVQQLDNLLERYLLLLDTHQKLQESLGKQLSSGFFQLAHANYVSPGRRFGEDFYDERMKATRRLRNVTSLPDNDQDSSWIDTRLERVQFEVEYKSVINSKNDEQEELNDAGQDVEKAATETVADDTQPDHTDETNQQAEKSSGITTPPTQPQDAAKNNNEDKGTGSTTKTKSETVTKKKKKIFRSDDPISWYGILVPSSLKSAQKSFTEAIDDGIPHLVSVISEMRRVEDMVYELRKEIYGSVEAK